MMAYIRRKRLEAQLVAAELAKLLGGTNRKAGGERVHGDELLGMMGITL